MDLAFTSLLLTFLSILNLSPSSTLQITIIVRLPCTWHLTFILSICQMELPHFLMCTCLWSPHLTFLRVQSICNQVEGNDLQLPNTSERMVWCWPVIVFLHLSMISASLRSSSLRQSVSITWPSGSLWRFRIVYLASIHLVLPYFKSAYKAKNGQRPANIRSTRTNQFD